MTKIISSNSIATIMMTLLLSSCINAPTETCMTEAEVMNGKFYNYPSREGLQPTVPKYVKDAKNLCWDMADIPQNTSSDAKTIEQERKLAKQCSFMLKNYNKDYPADVKHLNAMKDICKKMTHQKVD